MQASTRSEDGLDGAIDRIRRITSEESLDDFSNDERLDAAIEVVNSDDALQNDIRNRRAGGPVNLLAKLETAWYCAGRYNDSERATITRAITRHELTAATTAAGTERYAAA